MSERLCMCGKPEGDSVHHRPQTSDEEHLYEPAPTETEYYGTADPRPDRQTETQLVPCWHCGDDVPIDTADVILAASGVAWVCQECAT